VSKQLTQRIQHAVEAYERALAQDLVDGREEMTVRAIARADAVAAYNEFACGYYANAHFIARCARSRNPDPSNPTPLRDSVWRDFEIACTAVMELSMREESIAREDELRAAATRNAT